MSDNNAADDSSTESNYDDAMFDDADTDADADGDTTTMRADDTTEPKTYSLSITLDESRPKAVVSATDSLFHVTGFEIGETQYAVDLDTEQDARVIKAAVNQIRREDSDRTPMDILENLSDSPFTGRNPFCDETATQPEPMVDFSMIDDAPYTDAPEPMVEITGESFRVVGENRDVVYADGLASRRIASGVADDVRLFMEYDLRPPEETDSEDEADTSHEPAYDTNYERIADEDDVVFATTTERKGMFTSLDGVEYDTTAERMADDPAVLFALTREQTSAWAKQALVYALWFSVGLVIAALINLTHAVYVDVRNALSR